MVSLKLYSSASYRDIVLFDDETKRMFIINSEGKTDEKWNGCIYTVGNDEIKNRIKPLYKYELNRDNFFSDCSEDVSIEDLKDSNHFTVVINNDTLMCKSQADGMKIYLFKFKSEDFLKYGIVNNNKFYEVLRGDSYSNFDYNQIKSIKTDLIFRKKGL